jgi:hypothetical protein
MRIRSKRAAAVVGAAALALAGVTVPATAAYADSAPSCVYAYGPPITQSAYIENKCSYTVRVIVVVSWGPDSDCTELPPGWGFRYQWWPGSYNGMQNC